MGEWRGADIYPIGEVLFSQRFTQLINTFWLASIASLAVTGNGFHSDGFKVQTVMGTTNPDYLEFGYHKGWFAILIIASSVMLVASLAAAVFGALRRGPDILDRTSVILRDNPYARVGYINSMEDGCNHTNELRNIKICLGDVEPSKEVGHIGVGTIDLVKPMYQMGLARQYD
jgi:hypothetical protein